MEHLRLLLHMVLSMARTQATDAAGEAITAIADEWQEDSGLGLYRAPEEGATAGICAVASVHSVSLEKKVSLGKLGGTLLLVGSIGFLPILCGFYGASIRTGRLLKYIIMTELVYCCHFISKFIISPWK